MHITNTFLLFLSILILSCNISKRNEAEKIINKFSDEKIEDKREAIFEVYAAFENGRVIIKGETDNPSLKKELLSSLQSLKFKDEIIVLPDSSVGDKTYGLINLSVANLRSVPKHSGELATQALFGTPVKILKIEKDWYQIQTPDNYISWVDEAGVTPYSEIQFEDWKKSERIIFIKDNGLIFDDEQLKNPLSDVTMGNILEELERNPPIVKVRFPDGRIGFSESANWSNFNVFKKSIYPDTTQLKYTAKQLMGRPYLWGGTSARAMDCSGFVKTIYFMNGIILARDASLQTRHGGLIQNDGKFNQLQTGDLLFFGRKKTEIQSESITHVAFSFGGTEYIHASGKIKMNSFNPESKIYSDYRKKSFIRARKIIGFKNQKGIQQIKNHPWY